MIDLLEAIESIKEGIDTKNWDLVISGYNLITGGKAKTNKRGRPSKKAKTTKRVEKEQKLVTSLAPNGKTQIITCSPNQEEIEENAILSSRKMKLDKPRRTNKEFKRLDAKNNPEAPVRYHDSNTPPSFSR